MRGAALLASAPALCAACTYVEIPAGQDGMAIARSMEYWDGPGARDWRGVVHPAGTWLGNKHAFFSIDTGDASTVDPNVTGEVTSEGMNEFGLTVSSQTLVMTEYQQEVAGAPTVWANEFVPWVLGSFSTVAEVVSALSTVRVRNPGLPKSFGAHWAVTDSSNHSVVVEYIGGEAVIRTNSVRVLTNDPPYDWHLLNLNTHVNLRPTWPDENADVQMQTDAGMGAWDGAVPQVVNHGWNLRGLPGDFTPPARFTRAFFLRQYALRANPVSRMSQAIVLATGILNNVYIPQGVQADEGALYGKEHTPYAVVKMPKLRRYLFRTSADVSWRMIDLTRIDFTRAASVKFDDGIHIRDVTDEVVPPPPTQPPTDVL